MKFIFASDGSRRRDFILPGEAAVRAREEEKEEGDFGDSESAVVCVCIYICISAG